jgi:hypothetical protein
MPRKRPTIAPDPANVSAPAPTAEVSPCGQPDGAAGSYFRPAPGVKVRPAYHPRLTPTLPSLKPTQPRRDRRPADYAARVVRSMEHEPRGDCYIGSAANGWRLDATDGHRAIFTRGAATPGAVFPTKALGSWGRCAVTVDEEFWRVLMRMKAVLMDSREPRVTLAIAPEASELIVAAHHHGDYAIERIGITGEHLAEVSATVSLQWLLDGLGCWPATLRIAGVGTPIWICTPDTRYALMPFGEKRSDEPDADTLVLWATEAAKGRPKAQAEVVDTQTATALGFAPGTRVMSGRDECEVLHVEKDPGAKGRYRARLRYVDAATGRAMETSATLTSLKPVTLLARRGRPGADSRRPARHRR